MRLLRGLAIAMCLVLTACGGGGGGGGGGGDGENGAAAIDFGAGTDNFSLINDLAGTRRAQPLPTMGAFEAN